ncbi:putative TNF receptor-associated factor 6 [Apostichopus japonicus]|uniref:Putative TNF receptor-associated factor 6 n=1 Tax=Stichopus japonicus TaxID=307972 RepID=A0A2G8KM62_STIJA|nr:putative TNF receptor-associated factor 6 [Apostichopus japonicus]
MPSQSRNSSTSSVRTARSSRSSKLASVEEKYGFEANFEPSLDKKYTCPVCLAGLREPVQTKCGHRFCRACIKKACGSQAVTKCPIDKIIFDLKTELFEDLAVKREVLSQKVLCVNKERGCSWTAELRYLEEHGDQCEFALVACQNGCGEEFIQQHAELHGKECPLRIISCSYCKENIVHRDLTPHFQVCPRHPVSCSLCGKTDLLREQLKGHLDCDEGDCPDVVVPCSFEEMGCNEQVKRDLLSAHVQDATQHHFQLMVSYTRGLKSQVQSHMDTMRETHEICNQLICEQADLARQITEQNKQIGHQAALLREVQQIGHSGVLYWKVELPSQNYTNPLLSPPFYTSQPGYKFRLCLELRGHVARSETHASLFVMMCRGEYDDQLFFPFGGVCHVTVFNQSHSRAVSSDQHLTTTIECQNLTRAETDNCQTQKRGRLRFMKTDTLIRAPYCLNRELFIRADMATFCASA